MGLDIDLYQFKGITLAQAVERMKVYVPERDGITTLLTTLYGEDWSTWPEIAWERYGPLCQTHNIDPETGHPIGVKKVDRWYMRGSSTNRAIGPILKRDLYWVYFEVVAPDFDPYQLTLEDDKPVAKIGEMFYPTPLDPAWPELCLPVGGWDRLLDRAFILRTGLPKGHWARDELRRVEAMVRWIRTNRHEYAIHWSS